MTRRPGILASFGIGLSVTFLFAGSASPEELPLPGDAGGRQFAFSLDEMNCFSSDIHLREPEGEQGDKARHLLLAAGSGGGTNGIPCSARDPKAPPKKRSRT